MANSTACRPRESAAPQSRRRSKGRGRLRVSVFTPVLVRAARDVVAELDQPCLLVAHDDTVRFANTSLLETLAIDGAVEGRSIFDIAGGAFDEPSVREQFARVRAGGRVQGWGLQQQFPIVGTKVLSLDLVPIRGGFFETGLIVMAMRDETARVALEHDIARRTHEEEDLAARLGRLRAGETPEATAQRIIDEVGPIPGYEYILLGSFAARNQFIPLAVNMPPSAPVAVGRPIPEARSRYLRGRALSGPWIENWRARPEDGSYGADLLAAGLRTVAYAPIHGPTSLVGLLAIGTSSAAAAERIGDQFPALLSFAAIAGALLGNPLERQNSEAAARVEIEQIVSEEAFEPVFQPIVDLGTGTTVGFEALTRFADGRSPAERFTNASLLGVGSELELAAIRRSLRAARDLPANTWIGVNTSPALVMEGVELAALLAEEPRHILIEITEHAAVQDYAALQRAVAALGDRVQVAVDDAGAGYSGLQRILELNADLIKLDMALVRGIDHDAARQALVAGMVHFARQTGSRLLAEGIESEAEAEALAGLGVELGQGYLFGRPAPVGSPMDVATVGGPSIRPRADPPSPDRSRAR